jgi:acyl carrier protein
MEIKNIERTENLTIARQQKTTEDIEAWLVNYLAKVLEIEPKKITTKTSFGRYSLDSSVTITLASDLGDWLGCEIEPTITYSYPTIESLAKHLAFLP